MCPALPAVPVSRLAVDVHCLCALGEGVPKHHLWRSPWRPLLLAPSRGRCRPTPLPHRHGRHSAPLMLHLLNPKQHQLGCRLHCPVPSRGPCRISPCRPRVRHLCLSPLSVRPVLRRVRHQRQHYCKLRPFALSRAPCRLLHFRRRPSCLLRHSVPLMGRLRHRQQSQH